MKGKSSKILFGLVLFICSVGVSFIIAEALLRIFGHCDIDGNFFLGYCKLKPYVLPVEATSRKINEYFTSNNSYIIYDSFLGWSSRPGSSSKGGLCCANSESIRTDTPYTLISKVPKQGVLRIAIFGDSFTHGNEVSFKNTWGYYLENNLRKQGINAEVLNFGMSGYGMDQAFLRWKNYGSKFLPDIVIFGLRKENMNRNVNLIRPFYYPRTGIPFSKPRFIRVKGAGLKLINVPALPPEKLIFVVRNPASWDLIKYEFWFKINDYKKSLLYKSRLFSLFAYMANKIKTRLTLSGNNRDIYLVDSESFQLALEIIREFRSDVESKGAKFYVVFLPDRGDLELLSKSQRLPFLRMLEYLQREGTVIHPEYRMFEEAKDRGLNSLFIGHYSSRSNELIADVISKCLSQQK